MAVQSVDDSAFVDRSLRFLEFVLFAVTRLPPDLQNFVSFTKFEDLPNDELGHLLTRCDKDDEVASKLKEFNQTTSVAHYVEDVVDGSLVMSLVGIKREDNLLEDSGGLLPAFNIANAGFFCLIKFVLRRLLSVGQEKLLRLDCIEARFPVNSFSLR